MQFIFETFLLSAWDASLIYQEILRIRQFKVDEIKEKKHQQMQFLFETFLLSARDASLIYQEILRITQ